MDCKSCRDHLSEYLDGTLGRRRSARVRAHLLACIECRADFESLQQLLRALETSAIPLPRPDFWPRTWNLLHTRPTVEQRAGGSIRLRYRQGSLALACALLLVVMGIQSYRLSHRVSQTTRPHVASLTPLASADMHTLTQKRPPAKRFGGTLRHTPQAICVDALIALHVGESAGDPLSDSGRLHYLNAESEQADLKFDGKLDIR